MGEGTRAPVRLRDDPDAAIAPLNREQAEILAWVDGFLLGASRRDTFVRGRRDMLREAFPWLRELHL